MCFYINGNLEKNELFQTITKTGFIILFYVLRRKVVFPFLNACSKYNSIFSLSRAIPGRL